jgi:diaminopimelate decarboxylase
VAAVEDLFLRDGTFRIGGADLATLLGSYSTPLYVYSGHIIDAEFERVRSLFPGFDILYSLKANPGLAICARLRSLGAGADVSSMGELQTALRAGFQPENIFFVGPVKTGAELAFAVEEGIYAIIVESAHELALLDKLASERSRRQRVLLRINTSESPSSPEVMVGGPSKFGFDEEAVVEDVRALNPANVDIAGIHVYSASQVLDGEWICRHMEHVLKLALRLSAELGFPLECIDFGGGFGVPYGDDENELDLAGISERTGELLGASASRLEGCRLVFELGRFLVARSGVFLTRVLWVKESRGKLFVLTDGGMNTFSRPVFMGVRHPVRVLNKMGERAESEYDVCGPVCTPIDCIGKEVMLPRVEPGDVIGLFNAGAYGYTMSLMNFMSLGWPAEVMVENGKVDLIRRARPARSLLDDQVIPDGHASE